MLRNLILMLVVLFFASSFSAANMQSPAGTIDFETVEKGYNSAYRSGEGRESTTVQILTIRSSDEFAGFWSKHQANRRPLPPVPKVDFEKQMVIAVLDAQHPTGGYALEVKGIQEAAEQLIVAVTKTSPGPSCMVTQAFTQPYHLIKTVQSNKQVSLSLQEVVNDCR